MSGLQAQLNSKATTAALSLAAEALGGEIDALDVGVGAVATAVASLGAAVAGKQDLIGDGDLPISRTADLQRQLTDNSDIRASMLATQGDIAAQLVYTQQDLTALTTVVGTKAGTSALSTTNALVDTKAGLVLVSEINSTLTSQVNALSSALGAKASTTALVDGLASKQSRLGESLQLGALTVSGTSDVATIKHNEGLALQTSDGSLTYAVLTPGGTTIRSLIIQENLVIPDASIAVEKINGLSAALTEKASVEDITTLTQNKQDLIDQTLTLNSGLFRLSGSGGTLSIQRLIDGAYVTLMAFQYNAAAGTSRVICAAEFRPTTISNLLNLDVLDTLTAGQVLAQNLYSRVQTDELFGTWAYRLPTDSLDISKISGLQLQLDDINAIRAGMQANIAGTATSLVYTQDELTALTAVVATKQGKINSLSGLITGTLTATTISATDLTCGTLEAGPMTSYVPGTSNTLVVAAFSTDASTLRFNGSFLDSYKTDDGTGRTLYLNHLNRLTGGGDVRIGSTLSIGMAPGNNNFACTGTGVFTGSLSASNFPSSSDARLKENVLDASLQECERIVLAVRPKTYNRIDMNGAPRIGYIAQHLDGQLSGGYRCIMGVGEDANGPLLSVDYSRIVPVLHGALLSALARIEALESRLQ
jgi:hypothetical protein